MSQTFDSPLKLIDILSVMLLAALVNERSTSLSKKPAPNLEASPEPREATDIIAPNGHQLQTLPKLPLSGLADTVRRYLESIHPLVSPEEFERASSIANKFISKDGEGPWLQERLQEREKSHEYRNWLYNPYVDGLYFTDRRPTVPFVSYFGSYPVGQRSDSPALKAAIISSAAYQYKRLFDEGQLRPEILNGEPMCMDSYRWLFNSCRIPGEQVDYPQKWPAQDFLLAIRKAIYLSYLCVWMA